MVGCDVALTSLTYSRLPPLLSSYSLLAASQPQTSPSKPLHSWLAASCYLLKLSVTTRTHLPSNSCTCVIILNGRLLTPLTYRH